jgi:uncharacterized membrane protein YGL010W
MSSNNKLMEMLTGYAAAHQHPFNIFVHMIGIPTIMLGVMIPLTWIAFETRVVTISLAHVLVIGFFIFYFTLDRVFAVVFLVAALLLTALATRIGSLPLASSASIAAIAFFGGYFLQFAGHAVEKSMPVLVKHPVQANLAAPFFTVVEAFKLLGLRRTLFDAVQSEISASRAAASGSAE